MEIRGNVVSTPAETADEQENSNANVVPMKIKADFNYEELVQESASGIRSVRYYDECAANIDINGKASKSILPDANRYVLFNRIIKKNVVDRVAIASLQSRLTQKQWQLIDIPGNSMIVDQLIAGKELEEGKAWEPNAEVLADILLLDSIEESNIEIKVTNVRGKLATISLFGNVNGVADDASCGVRVTGKLVANRTTKRVESVELTIRHKKDEGQVGPGFDVLIKIEADITPRNAPDRLTKSNITKIRGHRSISSDLILESPLKTIQFVHDRRWRSVINSPELMVLRLLDDGQVLGQCNVIPMPRLGEADDYTIEDFKKNVQQAVGESGQLTDSRARKTTSGNRIFEVEVTGEQSGVPLTWIYYHVSQSNGLRAMCIITTESELIDSVRGTELKLIDSLLIRSADEARQAREADETIRSR